MLNKIALKSLDISYYCIYDYYLNVFLDDDVIENEKLIQIADKMDKIGKTTLKFNGKFYKNWSNVQIYIATLAFSFVLYS